MEKFNLDNLDRRPKTQRSGPEIGALSFDTIERLLKADPTTGAWARNEDERLDLTRYAANHFNGFVKGGLHCAVSAGTLFLVPLISKHIFGSDKLEFNNANIELKWKQLESLCPLICHRFFELGRDGSHVLSIDIPVLISGNPKTIWVNGYSNNAVRIKLPDEQKERIVSDVVFDDIPKKINADRSYKLVRQAKHLSTDCTLPSVELKKIQGTNTGIPEIEKKECPGVGRDFVVINTGSTYHGPFPKDESASTLTTVNEVGKFALTVVHGCGNEDLPYSNSQTYSGILTKAALDSVQHAVLENGFKGNELKRYFWDVVKLLDADEAFSGNRSDIQKRGVTFGGIVLFRDTHGNQKKFVYGLGDTAVASTRTRNKTAETLHLQGNFNVDARDSRSVIGSLLPAFGPTYTRTQAEHITAKVLDVQQGEFIQIMTRGCGPQFYVDCDNEINGEKDTPRTMRCSHLPANGKLDVPELMRQAKAIHYSQSVDLHLAESELENFRTDNIIPLQKAALNFEDDVESLLTELTTTTGREKYNQNFSNARRSMPEREEIRRIQAGYKDAKATLDRAQQNLMTPRNCDVLHASIDVQAAFSHIGSIMPPSNVESI